MAQTVKRLSTMREIWVRSLGWEDPLEKEMAIASLLEAHTHTHGLPFGSVVKNLPAKTGNVSLILELGRSPGEGNSNPLQ